MREEGWMHAGNTGHAVLINVQWTGNGSIWTWKCTECDAADVDEMIDNADAEPKPEPEQLPWWELDGA